MDTRTKSFRIISTNPSRSGFGFFDYAQLLTSAAPPRPLIQIFSLMRINRCDFVVEEELASLTIDDDEADLLKDLTRQNVSRQVLRLTFFQTSEPINFLTDRDLALERSGEDLETFQFLTSGITKDKDSSISCLGYIDLYNDFYDGGVPHSYVRSAVVHDFPENDTHRFLHSKGHYRLEVLGANFVVRGSHFAQQQTRLDCCAHVAVMTCVQNIYAARGLSCPLTYQSINEYLSIDHISRHAYKGLTYEEIKSVFELADIDALVLSSRECSPNEVITAAYYAVESGLPAVIGFDGVELSHAMAVVGHTFDGGLWPGAATGAYFYSGAYPYSPSHSWVQGLIVQDDNFGPHCTLPRQTLVNRNPVVVLPNFPWAVGGRTEAAEYFATSLLRAQFPEIGGSTLFETILSSDVRPDSRESNPWFYRLLDHVSHSTHVMRTLPCTSSRYLNFLSDNDVLAKDDPTYDQIKQLIGTDPFWLVEISIPELYQRNNTRLGEILVHGNIADLAQARVSLFRLPGLVVLFSENEMQCIKINGDYHYDIAQRPDADFGELFVPATGN